MTESMPSRTRIRRTLAMYCCLCAAEEKIGGSMGLKKGPWTPEEDLMLISYIQEHGPCNWKTAPARTGLMRCSKSCRLRWTNYLRPGIKRGNFTAQEEELIIRLQALLGNRWAAIASYLPERTDNDIKNHWNTRLKKRLGKTHQPYQQHCRESSEKGQWERRLQTDVAMAKRALHRALSLQKPPPPTFNSYSSTTASTPPIAPTAATSCPYASSTENIARLLAAWKKNTNPNKDTRLAPPSNYSESTTTACSEGSGSSSAVANKLSPRFPACETDPASDMPDVNLFQGESKPDIQTDSVSLSVLLDSWLFEENNIGEPSASCG